MAMVTKVLAGLVLWAAGFSALYGLHGFGCAVGWGEARLGPVTVLSAALLGAWLVLLAIGAAWALVLVRNPAADRSRLLGRLALVSALAGLGGLLFTGAPVLLPAHCL